MGNWRNVNYGNALLPVDATGNGINNTIAAGSSSYRFSNTYSVLGNFSGQITSTLITGTAPFSIASTTKVANLNADFLDDQTGSYYQNSDNQSAGTLPSGRLTGAYTGITGLGTQTSIVVSGTVDLNTFTVNDSTEYTPNEAGNNNINILSLINTNTTATLPFAALRLRIAKSGGDAFIAAVTPAGAVSNTADIVFGHDAVELMRLLTGGSLYLGKTTGLAKFEIEGQSSATLGSSVDAFIEGGGSTGGHCQLGFGWSNGSTKPPVIIGSKTVLDSGNTKSEFFIAVRDVTTDTAPTIALTVKTDGKVELASTLTATGGIDAGANGTTLKCKIIQIGDWNMDSTNAVNVAHGLSSNYLKIRAIRAMILHDDGAQYFALESVTTGGAIGGGTGTIDSTNVQLVRVISGVFDSTNFDSTSFNRGFLFITYAT